MALFPLVRRIRSFQGPHSSCAETAESYLHKFSKDRERWFNFMPHTCILSVQLRFIVYFCLGLASMLSVFIFAVTLFIGYMLVHILLRFQYKMNILLVLMEQPQLNCQAVNKLCIYFLHVVMMLIGGFGWISLLYIDI